MSRRHRSSRVAWAAALLLVAVAYLPTLRGDFLQEDFALSALVSDGRVDPWQVVRYFFPSHLEAMPFFRPIPVLTGAIDLVFWDTNPFGFHFTNLLIHLLGALLVGRVAGRLARRPSVGPLAAIVYGLYPGNVEPVAWVEHRMVGLGLVFMLLALHVHPVRRWRPVAWLAGFAAFLCKESALLLLPAVVLFHFERTGPGPRMRRVVEALRASVPYAGAAALYLLWRLAVYGRLDTGHAGYDSVFRYFVEERVLLDLPASLLRFVSPVNALAVPSLARIAHALLAAGGLLGLAAHAVRSSRGEARAIRFGAVTSVLALLLIAPILSVDEALLNSRQFGPPAAMMAVAVGAVLATVRRRWLVAVPFAFYVLPLLANIEPYVEAGRWSRAIRAGVEDRASDYDPAVRVVVANVPHTHQGVVMFVDGLMMEAALGPPFAPAKIPVVPLVRHLPVDPDGFLYTLTGPFAVLRVGDVPRPGRSAVEEAARPGPAWRVPAPETLRLIRPVGGVPVRLVDDPPFVFAGDPARAYYRLIFRTGAFVLSVLAERGRHVRVDSNGQLTYRLSAGDVFRQESFLDLPDAKGVVGRVSWWVEGVDDFRGLRSAECRSAEDRFRAVTRR
jgi:hypothetical protein